jgi:cyclic pyranopterin phosphate synthase
MSEGPDESFTHLDAHGRAVMVDVTHKATTHRRAVTSAVVLGLADAPRFFIENPDVLTEARMAGLRAAKATSELVPLCHPLPLEAISIDFRIHPRSFELIATAETIGQTGVEMEALVAVTVAALSLLGRVQTVHRSASIEGIGLEEKRGGRSGLWRRRADEVPEPGDR